MEINFTAIIISSLFTIVTYLGIPLIIAKISKKELTPKRVKKIVIINGVCWWIFFRILNPGSAGAAAWVWSGIAYAILNQKCKKENSEENLQEKRVEIAEKESPEERIENVVDTSMDSNTYGDPQDLLFCPVCCAQLLNDSIFCSRCGNKVQGKREPPPRKKKRVPKGILISIFSIFSILAIIIAIVCYFKVFIPKNTYDKAEDLFANAEYSEAYEIFISLGEYKDSVKKSKDCLYIQATTLRNEKKWEEANAIFEKIKGYKDSDALIHHHHYIEVASSEPTCITAGYKDLKCEWCDETLHSDLKARGHNYSDATCFEPQKCYTCGHINGSALGHNVGEAKCSRCGTTTFQTLTYSGRGPGNVTGINLPRGQYNIIFTHSGSSNFIVDGNIDGIFVNQIGKVSYVCQVSYETRAKSNGFINIEMADGYWTITIEAIG